MAGYEWAEEAVEGLAIKGIVNGIGNDKFAPGDNVTREEFAKMIVTLFNFNVVPDEFKFEDVPEDSWYYEYVRRAYGSKVVKGISEELFGSGMNILRQDAIVMAYNALVYADKIPAGQTEKVFFDIEEVSDYAQESVKALSSAGLVSGDGNGYLNPLSDITRAEAAMIIYNILTKVATDISRDQPIPIQAGIWQSLKSVRINMRTSRITDTVLR